MDEDYEEEESLSKPKYKSQKQDQGCEINKEYLRIRLNNATTKARLGKFDKECYSIIQKAINQKLKTMLECLISIARQRQAWQSASGNEKLLLGKVFSIYLFFKLKNRLSALFPFVKTKKQIGLLISFSAKIEEKK